MATDELASKLQRRNDVIDGAEQGVEPGSAEMPSLKVFNVYTEFKELSRKEIQHYQKMFNQYDTGKDKFIDFQELKYMMEKLGAPQTHLALKEMIKEIDEDYDGKICFREFLLIFRKAAAGELQSSGLNEVYKQMHEIDVDKEGVKGAKHFFEAKIDDLNSNSKFEKEIREEQEERKRLEEEKKQRKAAFKDKATVFQMK
jgi:EF-hand domain-containing family member D2